MKILTLGLLIGASALASSASIVACSQAKVQCTVGHAGAGAGVAYATRYFPKGTATGACDTKGDLIGLESYHPPGGGSDGKLPDFSKPAGVAIQNSALGDMVSSRNGTGSVDDNAAHTAFALGTFTTLEPDANDFCAVNTPTAAEKQFPAIEESNDPGTLVMTQPALGQANGKYTWTNVKVYVTAAAQGTQFSGDVHINDTRETVPSLEGAADLTNFAPKVDPAKPDAPPNPPKQDPAALDGKTLVFTAPKALTITFVTPTSNPECSKIMDTTAVDCVPADIAAQINTQAAAAGVDVHAAIDGTSLRLYPTKSSGVTLTIDATASTAAPLLGFSADGGNLTSKFSSSTCEADYSVVGVWPNIPCGADGKDADGNPITVPDPAQCCPNADPFGGRPTGSGINPDFPVICDPVLFQCVLDVASASELPAIKPGWDAKVRACDLTPQSAAQ